MSLADRMKAVADATGANVVVGVRSHERGWFAHCNGTEADGGSPETALDGLVGLLTRKLQSDVATAKRTVAQHTPALEALEGLQG